MSRIENKSPGLAVAATVAGIVDITQDMVGIPVVVIWVVGLEPMWIPPAVKFTLETSSLIYTPSDCSFRILPVGRTSKISFEVQVNYSIFQGVYVR